MREEYAEKLHKSIQMAEEGAFDVAIVELNQILEISDNPVAQSYKAYCEANIYGSLREAITTCQKMLNINYLNPVHYLIMGRLFLMSNNREKAMHVFRRGLKIEPHPMIISELKKLGVRKKPVISSLERSHPLNKVCGKILSTLNLG